MTSFRLNRNESAAVEAILADDLSDPIELISRLGFDKRTFFQYHTFSDLDFRKSNLEGVSFRGARLYRCRMTIEQSIAIDATNPTLNVDREILQVLEQGQDIGPKLALEKQTLRILVVGVGGGCGHAVNFMIAKELGGVEFIVADTDLSALKESKASVRIQLGPHVTEGLGAGARPTVGAQAAEESIEEVVDRLVGADLCFIIAGMGGGTGTGGARVIAQAARELGLLTVGMVTQPFRFEGTKRMRQAEEGIKALQKIVDTLIIIPNQNLFGLANESTTFTEAFALVDDVLYQGVKGVTDLMVRPGLINLDVADMRAVMGEMGKAMIGSGEAGGENRAVEAAEKALLNPLLEEFNLADARSVLINIAGGYDLTLFELDEAAYTIREKVHPDANIIVGSTLDDSLEGRLRVNILATGFEANEEVKSSPEALSQLQISLRTD